ncbi:MAG: class I SAM-dependent methyltransferase [Eubacteriales bacterium]|nr:class I SAM-dependent methyltransferase [Eubacteriales bacterium]
MDSIIFYVSDSADGILAKQIAEKLHTEIVQEIPKDALYLCFDQEGLSLCKGKLSMRGDYTQMLSRILPGKLQHEKLVKAAKIKGIGEHPTAIDATAGMGEDTLILAAAGFHILMYEKDPVICLLLEDTLRRAAKEDKLAPIVARMQVVEGDSVTAMRACTTMPDLIYLDPMFPARTKSGLIKKKFQLLQQLESPASDGEDMLQAAISANPRKIVIKRPQKGEYLGGVKPSYSIPGKAIRYDCLLFPR